PGTALYAEARRNGWIEAEELVDDTGVQLSAIGYPHLSRTEIYSSVDEVYRRFYFRPRKMISLGAEMLRDRHVMRRRLSEGRDFLRFLRKHRAEAPAS
ncbi:MAG: hopanoid biosynthesis associated radical SAM protein HpnJ, partial [Candidatus Rokubacteria bacterium]|nr:hopanoid biosynthesis associated radical SAM protein HpnJ [Candidatus Rokubacteria bacterium]